MHVLSIIHYPVYGGPHNRNASVAPGLREHGVDLTVLLPSDPGNAVDRLTARGLRVITMPLHRLRVTTDPVVQIKTVTSFSGDVRRLREVIRRDAVDLVIVNGLVNAQGAIAGRLEDVPVVWQLLDTFAPMPLRRAMMPVVSALADSVMTSGMGVAREHPGALAFGDRLVPFFSIVDHQAFRGGRNARAIARRELGLADGDLVVGNINNVNPMKGHDTFVRAAAALARYRPGIRFVILGAQYPQHDAYTRGLWKEASRLGLRMGTDLIVIDPRGRVADLAPAFDVFWLSSNRRSEGVSTVVGEAMCLELPVVATDVGSVREAVAEGITGFLVPSRDPNALAVATLPLIDKPLMRQELGRAGRRRAEQLYSLSACVAKHRLAFDEAVRHHATRSRFRARDAGGRDLRAQGAEAGPDDPDDRALARRARR